MDLNEFPAGFDDDDSVSAKDELRQIMLQHDIIFKNQVRELHRLYWTQKNLMNELFTKRASSSSSRMEMNLEEMKSCLQEVGAGQQPGIAAQLPGENVINDPMLCDEVWDLNESSCDEILSRDDQVDKVCANGESSAFYRSADLNVVQVIDLESPPALKFKEEASTSHSSDFRMLTQDSSDNSQPKVSVSTEFGSVSKLQKCSHSVVLSENGHLDHQKGEENVGDMDAGLNHSVGLLSTSLQTKKQPPKFKILQIDLNLSLEEESANCFPDPQVFLSQSRCSTVMHNGEMRRELSSQVPKDSLPSNCYPKERSSNGQTDGAFVVSENLTGCGDVHPPFKQGSVHSTAQNYGKNIFDKVVCKSTVESPVECYKSSGEACPSLSSGGVQNSTNVTVFSYTNSGELGLKNVDPYPSWTERKAESLSSKQASRETSSDDVEDNYLHESTASIHVATDEEKQPCDNGNDKDTLFSHVINVRAAQQLDDPDSSLEKHKPDEIGNSRCSMGNKSPSAGPNNMPNAEGLAAPKSNNLDPGQLCVNGVTTPEASSSVFVHDQHSEAGVSELHAEQQAVEQELEHTVKKAADILIRFCSDSTASPNCTYSDEENETECNIGTEQPQFSLDSFEKLTLSLEEIQDDGNSIPVGQKIRNEAVDNACMMKFHRGRRRGRALRDFQNDVLPGLISLSRHEICEDMHTIKCQIKKNEPQKATEETTRVSARSRRSRLRN